jgi:hypothetical protein
LCRNCLLEQITEGKIEGMIELTGKARKKISAATGRP